MLSTTGTAVMHATIFPVAATRTHKCHNFCHPGGFNALEKQQSRAQIKSHVAPSQCFISSGAGRDLFGEQRLLTIARTGASSQTETCCHHPGARNSQASVSYNTSHTTTGELPECSETGDKVWATYLDVVLVEERVDVRQLQRRSDGESPRAHVTRRARTYLLFAVHIELVPLELLQQRVRILVHVPKSQCVSAHAPVFQVRKRGGRAHLADLVRLLVRLHGLVGLIRRALIWAVVTERRRRRRRRAAAARQRRRGQPGAARAAARRRAGATARCARVRASARDSGSPKRGTGCVSQNL
jgi:hypothetical protein